MGDAGPLLGRAEAREGALCERAHDAAGAADRQPHAGHAPEGCVVAVSRPVRVGAAVAAVGRVLDRPGDPGVVCGVDDLRGEVREVVVLVDVPPPLGRYVGAARRASRPKLRSVRHRVAGAGGGQEDDVEAAMPDAADEVRPEPTT